MRFHCRCIHRSVRLQKDIAKEMQIVDAIFDEMLSNNDEVNVYDDRNRGNEESRRILTNPSQQRCDFADEMQKTDGICDGQRPKNEKQDTAVGHRTITDSGRTDEQESLISGNDFDVRLTADVHASSEHAGNTETCYDGDSSSGKSVDLMREHVKLLNELAVTNEMMSNLCTDLQSIAKCWKDSERTVAAVVKKCTSGTVTGVHLRDNRNTIEFLVMENKRSTYDNAVCVLTRVQSVHVRGSTPQENYLLDFLCQLSSPWKYTSRWS